MPERKMCPFQRRADMEVPCRDTCALWQNGKCALVALMEDIKAINQYIGNLVQRPNLVRK